MSLAFLRKCLEEIENGLVEINPDDELSERHLRKAQHNLRAATKLFQDSDEFLRKMGVEPNSLVDIETLPGEIDESTELLLYDWAVVTSYYAIYHAILSLLISIGYSSKNHACAISALEHFFLMKNPRLGGREILVIRRTKAIQRRMVQEAWSMKDRREKTAYGVALSTERYNAQESLRGASEFLEIIINLLDDIGKTPPDERVEFRHTG
jgi:uncharacterized protein (UPF0332 family)